MRVRRCSLETSRYAKLLRLTLQIAREARNPNDSTIKTKIRASESHIVTLHARVGVRTLPVRLRKFTHHCEERVRGDGGDSLSQDATLLHWIRLIDDLGEENTKWNVGMRITVKRIARDVRARTRTRP